MSNFLSIVEVVPYFPTRDSHSAIYPKYQLPDQSIALQALMSIYLIRTSLFTPFGRIFQKCLYEMHTLISRLDMTLPMSYILSKISSIPKYFPICLKHPH